MSRSAARGLGSAELANKTKSPVAEHKRVLGCAVDADIQVGGRNDSRPSLWDANASEVQGVHNSRSAFTGAGHRSQYCVIQHGGRRVAQDLAGRRAGAVSLV